MKEVLHKIMSLNSIIWKIVPKIDNNGVTIVSIVLFMQFAASVFNDNFQNILLMMLKIRTSKQ